MYTRTNIVKKFKTKIYTFEERASETTGILEVEDYINKNLMNKENIEYINTQFVYKSTERNGYYTDALVKAIIMYYVLTHVDEKIELANLGLN